MTAVDDEISPLERAANLAGRLAANQLQAVLLADARSTAIAAAVDAGHSRAHVARELGISWTQVDKAVRRAARRRGGD